MLRPIANSAHKIGPAARLRRRRRLGLVFLGLCGALLLCAAPASADEADTAVEAFAAAGTVLGVSPGPNEKQIAKVIVRCVISKTSVLTCGRDEALRALPEDMRRIVMCMLQGRPIEACASAEVIRHMPPQTQELATCIAQRSDLGNCATHAVVNSAQRRALDLLEKLKADARSELGQASPGPIRNIINVTEGIRDDDWAKVSLYGGAEVYKVAVKIMLRIVISATPAGICRAPTSSRRPAMLPPVNWRGTRNSCNAEPMPASRSTP